MILHPNPFSQTSTSLCKSPSLFLPIPLIFTLLLIHLSFLLPVPANAAWGTGTIVGVRGEILTAAHVVHQCHTIQILTNDGRQATARIEAIDPIGDLALLRARLIGGSPPRIREGINRNEIVHVFGFPVTAEGHPVFSSSKITRLSGPRGERDAFSLHGRMTLGESGSGVFDTYGNLVGVAYSTTDRHWYAIGAGRISEFLLNHGVPISSGSPVGNPSIGQIAAYLRLISVHIRC